MANLVASRRMVAFEGWKCGEELLELDQDYLANHSSSIGGEEKSWGLHKPWVMQRIGALSGTRNEMVVSERVQILRSPCSSDGLLGVVERKYPAAEGSAPKQERWERSEMRLQTTRERTKGSLPWLWRR